MNPVDPSKLYRILYPAVPAIISCRDRSLVYAMPVVSVISLSNNPPLIGVASSPSHSTHQAIVKMKSFSLSWVDSSLVRALEVLGTTPTARSTSSTRPGSGTLAGGRSTSR